MKIPLLALALLCSFAGTLSAADNPFAGTWKLDLSKSHVTGTTFTYSKTSDGRMRYDDGANRFTFGIDGKEYPTLDERTTTWVANSVIRGHRQRSFKTR